MGILTSSKTTQPQQQQYKTPAFTYHNMINHNKSTMFQQEYQLMDLLGKGSYAQVRKVRDRSSGVLRAVKIIDRVKNQKIQPLLLNQFHILKQLDHPNILKIYAIYQRPAYYYIVTELCTGKQLYQHLKQSHNLPQKQSARIVYQIASAVSYLHSRSIMHRDLKPENVMYDAQSKMLKLIDFGSALQYDSDTLIQRRRVGTTYYIAPQVITKIYNSKCDVWSLGVILYMLLSGEPPFKGKTDEEVLANIQKGQYNFKKNIWESISSQAKMLLTDMLTYNPNGRPTMSGVLKADWFVKYKQEIILPKNEESMVTKALSNMNKFKKTKSNNIQGAMLVFVVNFVNNPGDQAELQKSFIQLDLNGDGLLSLQQITIGMQKYFKVSRKQARTIAQAIFSRIDTNNSGFIDYSEFIVAANSMQIAASKENLEIAFDCMDKDKNGFLSAQELQQKLNKDIPKEVYQNMLQQFQLNSDGQISKQNFVAMMTHFLQNS